ncbi:MAG: LCP family protein [Clostridia bacterium]|nr:LCP family protein [Clostridia bacterium]
MLTLVLCCTVILVSVGGIAGLKAIFQGGIGIGDDIFDTSKYEDEENYVELYKGRKYVLLLGTDARASDGGKMTRADTIMLACLNTEKQQLALYSIPRDTYVYIPGYGYDKINATTVYGGTKLCMEVVSNLVGVEVEDYVLIDYGGFEAAVDALGGVTLNVEEDMYHYDPEENGIYTINLKAGLQHLDGNKALQYVRYRTYELGDIARASTQQRFLVALYDQLFSSGSILKLPDLVSSLSTNLKTSLSFKEMYQLASTGASMENLNIATQTLPGTFMDLDGISYWKVNRSVACQALIDIFEEGKTSEIIAGTGITGYSSSDSKSNSYSGSEMDEQFNQSDNASEQLNDYSYNEKKSTELSTGHYVANHNNSSSYHYYPTENKSTENKSTENKSNSNSGSSLNSSRSNSDSNLNYGNHDSGSKINYSNHDSGSGSDSISNSNSNSGSSLNSGRSSFDSNSNYSNHNSGSGSDSSSNSYSGSNVRSGSNSDSDSSDYHSNGQVVVPDSGESNTGRIVVPD